MSFVAITYLWLKCVTRKGQSPRPPFFNIKVPPCQERRPKKEPTSIFEHFVVVGLHPSTNVEATEAAFARKKAWERELHDKVERLVGEVGTQKQAPPASTLEPQVLCTTALSIGLNLMSL